MKPYERHIAPLESVPSSLRDLPIWCAWKLIEHPDKKPGKMPISPVSGRSDGWTTPGFCVTAAQAIDFANSQPDLTGVGLVVGNGISGGDLDNCIADGQASGIAAEILAEAATYTEVSPGLSGYRFLFSGTFGGNTGNNRKAGVEFYEDSRFLTFTGLHVPGASPTVEQRNLVKLGAAWFDRKEDAEYPQTPVPQKHEHVDIDALPISDDLRQRIRDGADKGARSEVVYRVACDLIHAGQDDATICHILTDRAYGISTKAFSERAKQTGAMRWAMAYPIRSARNAIEKGQAEMAAKFKPITPSPSATPPADGDEWPWEPPVDPYDEAINTPPYTPGMLPPVYEAFIEANYQFHSKANREAYAGLFLLAVATHVRPSVRVEEKPGAGASAGSMFSINEQAGIVGASTNGKTPTLFHVLNHDRDASSLTAWGKKAVGFALEKRNEVIAKLRKEMVGDDRALQAAIRKVEQEMRLPDVVNSKMSDKALIETAATNSQHDVPMDIIIDEFDNLYSGSSYRGDGGNAMSDIFRKMADNNPYSDKTSGGGKVESDRLAGNLGFACTPSDMAAWFGYPKALANGTLGRQSLFAPGKPFDDKRPDTINRVPIDAWRSIQTGLHALRNVNLSFEFDRGFDEFIDKEVTDFGAMADSGSHVTIWLAKITIRLARMAAAMFLVDELVAGREPRGDVTIPKSYRRRAWAFLTEFAWPHQLFVHNTLIGGVTYQSALEAIIARIHAKPDMEYIKADDLIGGHAPQSTRNKGDDFIKVLLFGTKWIRPKTTRSYYDRRKPWTAFQFEINPGVREICATHSERLKKNYSTGLGKVKAYIERASK